MTKQKWLGTTPEGSNSIQDPLRRFLTRSISGTFGLKIVNMALVYANSLLLVKLSGTRSYGEYVYVIAWLQILLIPAAMGFEGLIGRELAVYTTKEQWAGAKGLLLFANKTVLLNSVFLTAAVWLGIRLFNPAGNSSALTFTLGLCSLPFLALSRIRNSSLQAIKNVVLGQLPDDIARPGIIFVALVGAYFLTRHREVSSSEVMLINLVATIVAFGVGAILLKKKLAQNIQISYPKYARKAWLKAALPMLLIGSMYVINTQTDSVMLGFLKQPELVGFYTVANRGAGLVSFVQLSFSTSLAPVFATLHAQGDLNKLKAIIRKSCRSTFLVSLLLAIVIGLGSHWFLLIFGAEFLTAKLALLILLLGNLVNAFTGATARLLIMTGHARDTAIGVSISAFSNIILNALLIPPFGLEGAAIATAISSVLWNVLLVAFTYKRFGVFSTAI